MFEKPSLIHVHPVLILHLFHLTKAQNPYDQQVVRPPRDQWIAYMLHKLFLHILEQLLFRMAQSAPPLPPGTAPSPSPFYLLPLPYCQPTQGTAPTFIFQPGGFSCYHPLPPFLTHFSQGNHPKQCICQDSASAGQSSLLHCSEPGPCQPHSQLASGRNGCPLSRTNTPLCTPSNLSDLSGAGLSSSFPGAAERHSWQLGALKQLPGEGAESPSLETFQTHSDAFLSLALGDPAWTRSSSHVPSSFSYSVMQLAGSWNVKPGL